MCGGPTAPATPACSRPTRSSRRRAAPRWACSRHWWGSSGPCRPPKPCACWPVWAVRWPGACRCWMGGPWNGPKCASSATRRARCAGRGARAPSSRPRRTASPPVRVPAPAPPSALPRWQARPARPVRRRSRCRRGRSRIERTASWDGGAGTASLLHWTMGEGTAPVRSRMPRGASFARNSQVGRLPPLRAGATGTMPPAAKSPHLDDAGRCGGNPVELRTYIVEDNATIRENLVDALEELASVHPLGWAESERAARDWLVAHQAHWDLLIVDLFLKQGSGLGVLEACRDRAHGQRVIVLSNYATSDMRRRCAELGADAVFDKSNEIDALVDFCLALG